MLSPVTKPGQTAGPARSPWPQLPNLRKLAERHQHQARLRRERSRVLADCSQVIRSRGWPPGQEVSCPPAEPDGFRDRGMAITAPGRPALLAYPPQPAVKASAHPGRATEASPGSAARPARGWAM